MSRRVSISIACIVAYTGLLLPACIYAPRDAGLYAESSAVEGNAARGKNLFERRCTGCHALDQNREGPHLRGVYGRVSGSVADFAYSSALKQAHITWNETSLEKWLTDPDVLVPGNNMEFHVAKAQERSDLIRFLKSTAR